MEKRERNFDLFRMDRTNFIWNSLDNNQFISKCASVIDQLNNSLSALKRISVIDIVHFSRHEDIRDLI